MPSQNVWPPKTELEDMIDSLDILLEKIQRNVDVGNFGDMRFRDIEPMAIGIQNARMAASNILSRYGDSSKMGTMKKVELFKGNVKNDS